MNTIEFHKCEDFPLRNNLLFGSSIQEIIANETQDPIDKIYPQINSPLFIQETEGLFNQLRELVKKSPIKTPGTEGLKLEKQYMSKFFPSIFFPADIYNVSENKSINKLAGRLRGRYAAISNHHVIPANTNEKIWYYGNVADTKCFIGYHISPEKKLDILQYHVSNVQKESLEFVEPNMPKYDSTIAKNTFSQILRKKYGEPTYSTSFTKSQLAIDILLSVIKKCEPNKMIEYLKSGEIWVVECHQGTVVICTPFLQSHLAFEESQQSFHHYDLNKSNMSRFVEYEYNVIYCFFPNDELDKLISAIESEINKSTDSKAKEAQEKEARILSEI